MHSPPPVTAAEEEAEEEEEEAPARQTARPRKRARAASREADSEEEEKEEEEGVNSSGGETSTKAPPPPPSKLRRMAFEKCGQCKVSEWGWGAVAGWRGRRATGAGLTTAALKRSTARLLTRQLASIANLLHPSCDPISLHPATPPPALPPTALPEPQAEEGVQGGHAAAPGAGPAPTHLMRANALAGSQLLLSAQAWPLTGPWPLPPWITE